MTGRASSDVGLERIEMPNDDPEFVRVLGDIVRRSLAAVVA